MEFARYAVAERESSLAGAEALHDVEHLDTGREVHGTLRPAATQKLKVLLVDDDEVDAKYISWLLGCIDRYSFDIVHVTSSEEALAADAGRRFDIYLVDFWLMHETSIPLINELGELHSHAPVVVLTNLNSGDIEDLGIRAGALGFLCKGDLSEKALELVILSSLFTRRVELELKERIATLEAQRDSALISGQSALFKVLAGLDAAHRACAGLSTNMSTIMSTIMSPGAGAHPGAAESEAALAELADEIRSARQGIFDDLAAPAAALTSQATDLREVFDRVLAAYRYEARLKGVSLAMDMPAEPVRLDVVPVLLQALLVAVIDGLAKGHPESICVDTSLLPNSVRIAFKALKPVPLGIEPPPVEALRLIADCIGAEIEMAEDTENGGLHGICVTLPAPAHRLTPSDAV